MQQWHTIGQGQSQVARVLVCSLACAESCLQMQQQQQPFPDGSYRCGGIQCTCYMEFVKGTPAAAETTPASTGDTPTLSKHLTRSPPWAAPNKPCPRFHKQKRRHSSPERDCVAIHHLASSTETKTHRQVCHQPSLLPPLLLLLLPPGHLPQLHLLHTTVCLSHRQQPLLLHCCCSCWQLTRH
jgi:hypothetical protein